MFTIRWTDGTANWEIEFEKFEHCERYLNKVFHNATLYEYQTVIGGVRPVKPEEKKRRNHKWFRWIERDQTKSDFISELEDL